MDDFGDFFTDLSDYDYNGSSDPMTDPAGYFTDMSDYQYPSMDSSGSDWLSDIGDVTSDAWDGLKDFLVSQSGGAITSGAAKLITGYLQNQAIQSGANKQSGIIQSASDKSLAAQKEMAQKAIDAQLAMYQSGLNIQQPYIDLGTTLLPTYALHAAGQDPGRMSIQNLADGDLYEWQKEQATDALNKQLAARGRYDSGAAIKGFSDLYRTMAGEEANKRYERAVALENADYARLVDAMNLGRGASATGSSIASGTGNVLSGIYSNLGGNLGNTYLNYGQAMQAPTAASVNATGSMYGKIGETVTSAVNNAQVMAQLQKLLGG